MKRTKLLLLIAILITACHSHKKNTASTAVSDSTRTKTTPDTTTTKYANGVYAPGEAELKAIKAQYNNITLGKLTEGYFIYTGICINCHAAKNIYKYSVEQWKGIMDVMAHRAELSDTQKDAVYKYVLAIKAVKAN